MQHQQKLGNFIDKLQYLLSRSQYSQIIRWDKTQTMIDVICESKMETQIIPFYFRHRKYESFVRQLNLYGFKKVKSVGRHRFTHSQLLNGEKIQSIKTHKSNKIDKKIKKEIICNVFQQPENVLQRNLKNEESNSCQKNKNNQHTVKPNFAYQQCMPNINLTVNCQSQPLAGFANSCLGYWNFPPMGLLNPYSGFIYLNSMHAFK